MPESKRHVSDARRRVMDWKKFSDKSGLPAEEEAKWVRQWERVSRDVRALQRVDPDHCVLHRSGEAQGVRNVLRLRADASLGSRCERECTELATRS